jgi:NAD(P)-dependent dehydrogenase (short-subunit alcohol dehydrogenase family)
MVVDATGLALHRLLRYLGVTVTFGYKVAKGNLMILALQLIISTNLKMSKLQNKVAVITGGNSGIGFGIAEAFQQEGAIGTITGRNRATLARSVQELGTGFMGIQGDVTRTQDLERIFKDTFERFGKIDTVVVNAGGVVDGSPMSTIVDVTEGNYDGYMNLNLKSAYFTVQQALPYLHDGASIILIGSSAAHRAAPGMTIYAAAKAAVISLAKGLSLDLLDRKIRVNTLSPGSIDTPAFDKLVPQEQLEQVKQVWIDLIPTGRMGLPSEMGKAAVFLASDDSSFIVGTEILADGGMTNISLMK